MPKRDWHMSESDSAAAISDRRSHAGDGRQTADSTDDFWLVGENVLCACPDCGSAINIRVWLMVADCWNCGTSIELATDDQQAIDQLIRRHQTVTETDSQPTQKSDTPATVARSDSKTNWRTDDSPFAKPSPVPQRTIKPPSSPSQSSSQTNFPTRAALDAPPRQFVANIGFAEPHAAENHWFHDLPAWLTSLIIHLLLLILLAIWVQHRDQPDPTITLSMAVSKHRREGDRPAALADEARFDLPAPDDRPPQNKRELSALLRADQDAKPLRIDPNSTDPNLTALDHIKSLVQSSEGHGRALATRDPRLRREVVQREGGTSLTEAAVARGLHWLSTRQNSDGSWSLQKRGDQSAGTSLALLPFLGAGQTHLFGIYKSTVSGGLRYLLENQAPNGSLRGDANDQHYMYVHGQATIVLCESFAMTHDERFREPAQKALDFIVAAQYPRGGWRYKPRDETDDPMGDTSVLGWQVMALQSGRMAGLYVPDHTLQLADQYLDLVSQNGGATYGYQIQREASPAMTAEGLLCRLYLGWHQDNPALQDGVEYLSEEIPELGRKSNYYYWYYATQVMHHVGGRPWTRWNRAVRNALVDSQLTDGRDAGSWPNNGHQQAGQIYSTSLAVCTLEVYYRHAPIFRRINLD